MMIAAALVKGIVELATFLAATASMMMLIMWALFRGVPGAFVSTLENTEAFQMGLFDSIYYFVPRPIFYNLLAAIDSLAGILS